MYSINVFFSTSGRFSHCEHMLGSLAKQGGSMKNWKSRYFVLKYGQLSYYAAADKRDLKGTIELLDVTSVSRPDIQLLFYLRLLKQSMTGSS